ncbi:MAG TPA: AMP-binding protein [Rhizomicrobium sp.]
MSASGEEPELISIGARLREIVAAQPRAPAVTAQEVTLSWAELDGRSNRMARGLLAGGVTHGDFVTIALPNGLAFVEACYACWKIGAVPQPVSSRLPANELAAIVELAKSPVVVSDVAMAAPAPVVSSAALLGAGTDASALPDAVSPSWKAPTSGGSTGRPKLIVSGTPGLTPKGGGPTNFWLHRPDTVALMPGPLYHNGPFSNVFNALNAGGHVIVMAKFDAEATLREVERHRANWIYLVPTMMSRIWRLPNRADYDASSLKTVWHLAAPCPPQLKQHWIDWLGADAIWELYGGTEAQAATTISGREWLSHRGSVGRVLPGGEMKAFDAQGRPLPPGETGEIFMRRAAHMPPTYRYIGAEARALADGWESIGDIGRFDEEGYLYLADRRTDMILVGGANVYPAEVEAALDEHPLVASSAVIGLPHEELGNQVHAIVQPRPGLDVEDLKRHLAERLVIYKQPRTFELVEENVRDDAGKVRRSALRDERVKR